MDAVTYLKAKNRMTNKCDMYCEECLLDGGIDGCVDEFDPQRAVEIVEKWLAEHPPVTYASKMRGYETCQDIPTIKEELDRLSVEMDKYSQLASKEAHNGKSIEYYRKSERARIRYWAIRWTMGWEKEIPNV